MKSEFWKRSKFEEGRRSSYLAVSMGLLVTPL